MRHGPWLVAAQRVHAGEHGADPLAVDWAGNEIVDANPTRAKFGGEFPRQCVQRRLGHDIGSTTEILGPRKDG